MSPPFRYEPYRSPYVGSISDLLQRPADIEAQRSQIVAQAQAQAAIESGRAWSGAVQGIAQTVGQLPGQIAGLQQQQQASKLRDLQMQQTQMQVTSQKSLQETQQQISALMSNPAIYNDDGTMNAQGIAQLLQRPANGGEGPMPPVNMKNVFDTVSSFNEDIAKTRESQMAWEAQKTNTLANAAAKILKLGAPSAPGEPDTYSEHTVLMLGAMLKSKQITPADATAILTPMTDSPESAQRVLQSMAARSTRPDIKVGKDDELVNPDTHAVTFSNIVPDKPTEAGFAADAVNPLKTPEQRAQAQAALDAMRKPMTPTSMDEQLLEAIASGNTKKADQIKQTLQQAAMAKKDPAAFSLASELGALRKQEAQARLDALRDKNKPLDIAPDVQTTISGKQYVDGSLYTAEQRDKAHGAANEQGIPMISKEQANAIQEIDNARANQRDIQNQIKDLLPKDATGRPIVALENKLSKFFQTNDQVAAYNSWRTAAIQTLRATAGSKGLRINQAEIAQAIENDIPKLTDTLGTAQQKLKNINTLLDNAENSILVRDRSAAPSTTIGVTVQTPAGAFTFPTQKAADDFKKSAGIR